MPSLDKRFLPWEICLLAVFEITKDLVMMKRAALFKKS